MFAVQMEHISKRFASLQANDKVNFDVEKGTIHALVGENGAGKSTLMNILYGFHQPDQGNIFIHEHKESIESPARAIKLGIGMVHQHFMLVPPLSVSENIILGTEPTRAFNVLDLNSATQEIERLSETYRLKIDPRATIASLSVGVQQRVEILKILYRNATILILDEPTAVLTPQEIDDLFTTLQNLKKQSKTVILITHKLNEVLAISDNVTVMRRGKVAGEFETAKTSQSELTQLMVGHAIEQESKETSIPTDSPVLSVQSISSLNNSRLPAVNDITFSVRGGEILGIAGVEGNGQTELVEVLTGLRSLSSGTISINNVEHKNRVSNVTIAHIPEDRWKRGIVLDFSLTENFLLGRQHDRLFSGIFLLSTRAIGEYAEQLIHQFDIRPPDKDQRVRGLSGGNQQKVVIARELSKNAHVIVASQPTRGLDIGAIEYVHHALLQERASGKAIVLVSSDLTELIKLSDLIAVIYRGKIVTTLESGKTSEREIGHFMTGGTQRVAVESLQ